jgi:hypothetical protein
MADDLCGCPFGKDFLAIMQAASPTQMLLLVWQKNSLNWLIDDNTIAKKIFRVLGLHF